MLRNNVAIIFAGGTGTRMNTVSKPKQFLEVHGKPVLIYTLEQYQQHSEIDSIILVCLEEWIPYTKNLIQRYALDKVKFIVPGGGSGQGSIYNGVICAHIHFPNNPLLLVHDGVRPLIDHVTISACIRCARQHGNAITTAPAIETIFVKNTKGQVGNIFNRSDCMMARAPQCFYLEDLYQAHQDAIAENKLDFIDSAMLMQYYGAELFTVDGPIENIKITTPTDFYLFRALLDAQENLQLWSV